MQKLFALTIALGVATASFGISTAHAAPKAEAVQVLWDGKLISWDQCIQNGLTGNTHGGVVYTKSQMVKWCKKFVVPGK